MIPQELEHVRGFLEGTRSFFAPDGDFRRCASFVKGLDYKPAVLLCKASERTDSDMEDPFYETLSTCLHFFGVDTVPFLYDKETGFTKQMLGEIKARSSSDDYIAVVDEQAYSALNSLASIFRGRSIPASRELRLETLQSPAIEAIVEKAIFPCEDRGYSSKPQPTEEALLVLYHARIQLESLLKAMPDAEIVMRPIRNNQVILAECKFRSENSEKAIDICRREISFMEAKLGEVKDKSLSVQSPDAYISFKTIEEEIESAIRVMQQETLRIEARSQESTALYDSLRSRHELYSFLGTSHAALSVYNIIGRLSEILMRELGMTAVSLLRGYLVSSPCRIETKEKLRNGGFFYTHAQFTANNRYCTSFFGSNMYDHNYLYLSHKKKLSSFLGFQPAIDDNPNLEYTKLNLFFASKNRDVVQALTRGLEYALTKIFYEKHMEKHKLRKPSFETLHSTSF